MTVWVYPNSSTLKQADARALAYEKMPSHGRRVYHGAFREHACWIKHLYRNDRVRVLPAGCATFLVTNCHSRVSLGVAVVAADEDGHFQFLGGAC